jgi:transcriptional regulator with XRE-family HTH domain
MSRGGATVPDVDTRSEIREFLTSRRARITPEQAGLRTYGNGPRRVPGLRREEAALLAGVSIAYYTKLERGDTSGVSETVLESLARALQLDEAERAHLFDLARAQRTSARPRRRRTPRSVRAGVQRLLDSITAPAMVRNGRMDILGTNELGRALYSEMFANPRTPVNSARFTFLDPRAISFFADWDEAADDSVAVLRGEAGRNPYDRDLSDLVGELSTQSEEFRTRWARHDVRYHDTGKKRLHHPLVGDLELTFEVMFLAADPDLTMFAFTAEANTKSEEALNLLVSWAAAPDQAQPAGAPDR